MLEGDDTPQELGVVESSLVELNLVDVLDNSLVVLEFVPKGMAFEFFPAEDNSAGGNLGLLKDLLLFLQDLVKEGESAIPLVWDEQLNFIKL